MSRGVIRTGIAALSGFVATAGGAADVGRLGCPIERLTADEQIAFETAVGEQVPLNDTRLGPFRRTLDACGREFAWSPELIQLARTYHLGRTGQAQARARLEGLGFDVPAIEQALLADAALIAAVGGDHYPDQEFNAFIQRLAPTLDPIVARQTPESGATTHLGSFIMFRALMESARARFERR